MSDEGGRHCRRLAAADLVDLLCEAEGLPLEKKVDLLHHVAVVTLSLLIDPVNTYQEMIRARCDDEEPPSDGS